MFDSDASVLLLVLVIAWWVMASIAVGIAAMSKGESGLKWFLGGIVFGPIFAILLFIANQLRSESSVLANEAGEGYSLTR